MPTRSLWAAFVIAIPLAAAPALAADCGDTSGPGGVDVPCNCGDTVTTSTRLGPGDPVTSTGPDDVCLGFQQGDFAALTVREGVNLDINRQHIRVAGIGILLKGDGITIRNGIIAGPLLVAGVISFGLDQAPDGSLPPAPPPSGFQLFGTRILDNEIRDALIGIATFAEGSLVENNRVSFDRWGGFAGIFVIGINSTVVGNVVFGGGTTLFGINAGGGSFFAGGRGVDVRRNTVSASSSGFNLDPSRAVIEDNEASGNGDGFAIRGNGGGVIRGNKAFRNGENGLLVQGDGHVVEGNRADQNRNGIFVGGSGNTLSKNTAEKNLDRGIRSITDGGGNVDGGGNKGKKNDFAQCEIDGTPCKK